MVAVVVVVVMVMVWWWDRMAVGWRWQGHAKGKCKNDGHCECDSDENGDENGNNNGDEVMVDARGYLDHVEYCHDHRNGLHASTWWTLCLLTENKKMTQNRGALGLGRDNLRVNNVSLMRVERYCSLWPVGSLDSNWHLRWMVKAKAHCPDDLRIPITVMDKGKYVFERSFPWSFHSYPGAWSLFYVERFIRTLMKLLIWYIVVAVGRITQHSDLLSWLSCKEHEQKCSSTPMDLIITSTISSGFVSAIMIYGDVASNL